MVDGKYICFMLLVVVLLVGSGSAESDGRSRCAGLF